MAVLQWPGGRGHFPACPSQSGSGERRGRRPEDSHTSKGKGQQVKGRLCYSSNETNCRSQGSRKAGGRGPGTWEERAGGQSGDGQGDAGLRSPRRGSGHGARPWGSAGRCVLGFAPAGCWWPLGSLGTEQLPWRWRAEAVVSALPAPSRLFSGAGPTPPVFCSEIDADEGECTVTVGRGGGTPAPQKPLRPTPQGAAPRRARWVKRVRLAQGVWEARAVPLGLASWGRPAVRGAVCRWPRHPSDLRGQVCRREQSAGGLRSVGTQGPSWKVTWGEAGKECASTAAPAWECVRRPRGGQPCAGRRAPAGESCSRSHTVLLRGQAGPFVFWGDSDHSGDSEPEGSGKGRVEDGRLQAWRPRWLSMWRPVTSRHGPCPGPGHGVRSVHFLTRTSPHVFTVGSSVSSGQLSARSAGGPVRPRAMGGRPAAQAAPA